MSRTNFKLYLKVKGKNNDELWISPEGTKKEYFLTRDRITFEEVKKSNQLKLLKNYSILKPW